jgi:hypothetical protein
MASTAAVRSTLATLVASGDIGEFGRAVLQDLQEKGLDATDVFEKALHTRSSPPSPALALALVVGSRAEAKCEDWSKHYGGEVTAVNANGTFNMTFDDGDTQVGVTQEQRRAGRRRRRRRRRGKGRGGDGTDDEGEGEGGQGEGGQGEGEDETESSGSEESSEEGSEEEEEEEESEESSSGDDDDDDDDDEDDEEESSSSDEGGREAGEHSEEEEREDAEEDAIVQIKLVLGDQIRRSELRAKTASLAVLQAKLEVDYRGRRLQVLWRDEEGDLITVDSEEDFQLMLGLYLERGGWEGTLSSLSTGSGSSCGKKRMRRKKKKSKKKKKKSNANSKKGRGGFGGTDTLPGYLRIYLQPYPGDVRGGGGGGERRLGRG